MAVRSSHVAGLTAFLAIGLLAGPASAATVPATDPAAVAEIAATPEIESSQVAAVSASESDNLAYAAFPVALLAIAAATVAAANSRREA